MSHKCQRHFPNLYESYFSHHKPIIGVIRDKPTESLAEKCLQTLNDNPTITVVPERKEGISSAKSSIDSESNNSNNIEQIKR